MAIEDIIATGVRPVAEYAAENEKVRALQQDNAQAPQRAALLAEQVKAAQTQNQLAQQNLRDMSIIRSSLARNGGDFDKAFADPDVLKNVNPMTLQSIQKSHADIAHLAAETKQQLAAAEKSGADTAELEGNYAGGVAKAVKDSGYNPVVLHTEIARAHDVNPKWADHLGAVEAQLPPNATPDQVKALIDPLYVQSGQAAKDQKLATEQTAAQGAQQRGAAAMLTAQTGANEKARSDASVQLAGAKTDDEYTQIRDSLSHGVAKLFPEARPADKNDVLKLGMSPTDITKTNQEAAKAIEEKRWHDVQAGFEKGKLGVEQAKLALSQKEFTAKFGSPESRSAFTESVVKNPDSYFSLPPDMKPGVAADLVSRGMSVPTQLPSDIKSRSASAGLTLQSIQRVRALLADPEIAGAIGPISGRLGNLEQNVGDTFFGEKDPRAQKEQQLRTELAYLKFQESKGLFGGRPAQQLIKSLSGVSANPTMSQNMITGSLAAMENSMKAVGNEARAYSFGGAEGAVNNAAQQQPPAAAQKPMTGKQKSTGAAVYSLDGGKTWLPGQPPAQ